MGRRVERGRGRLHGKSKGFRRGKRSRCQLCPGLAPLYFGQWPAPTSSGKQAAYQRAIDAYLQHARNFDSALEVVRIPYEGSEIIGYLRLPANTPRPVPLVLAISGLDSRKETVAETYAAALPEGIGFSRSTVRAPDRRR